MLLKRLAPRVPLEKVKHVAVVAVSGDAVVYDARLELRQPRRLGIHGFEGVGVFGECVDLWGGVSSLIYPAMHMSRGCEAGRVTVP